MAGAHIFQTIQHLELDTLGLVTIRDILKKRARYLRLVAQNNKENGVNVTPITVVASIDQELLENLIDMEEIDADSVEDCTDNIVIKFLESTQERDASVTAEYVKVEVLAKVTSAMWEKYPALRIMKAVADYYSLHRNLRLDFINGKPREAIEHLVSVIRPATLKALIGSKLAVDKSELKKDFLELVAYLKKMAIIHDEHFHVVDHKKRATLARRTWAKTTTLVAAVLDTTKEGAPLEVAETRRLTVSERSSVMESRRTRMVLERRLLEIRQLHLVLTQRNVKARSAICPTVLLQVWRMLLLCWLNTRRGKMLTRKRKTSRL
jgi:hypothetical protein